MTQSLTTSGPTRDELAMRERPRSLKLAERVTMTLSVLVVLVLAGYLVYRSLHSDGRLVPVVVRGDLAATQQVGQVFLVPFDVTNGGDRTLQRVRAQVLLQPAKGEPEQREIDIDYLPAGAVERVYVFFVQDPRSGRLTATPTTYQLR